MRLLDATLRLLAEGGLAACQVPAIAARAGVAVGTVYRRFRDKEALLDRTFIWAGEIGAANSAELVNLLAKAGGLSAAIITLVEAFTVGYATNVTFYKALSQYAQARDDVRFHDAISRSRETMMAMAIDGLMAAADAEGLVLRRQDIAFALTALTATLNATVVMKGQPALEWEDEPDRVAALSRLVERYLRP